MEKLNNFFDGIANPIRGIADWLLRIGLGIAFFLHGLYFKTYVNMYVSFICCLEPRASMYLSKVA